MREDKRYESLDGLRGFLALGVFFQHAVTNLFYFQTGIWQITEERLFRHLGGEAVILFFMITSFLYWSKVIAKKGNISALSLYKSRFFRLAPMYLFSAFLVTFLALVAAGFHINSFSQFFIDIISWLTLGLVTTTSVDGVSIIPINAGIHWTLHFEWFFYLALPLAALILRKFPLWLFALPVFAYALLAHHRGYWVIFLFGILAAHVVARIPRARWLTHKWAGILPIVGVIAVYLVQNEPYSILQYCITFGVFLCFVYGNDLFGLLKTKAATFLGTISYSIYLLHGIVLYLVLNTANYFYPIASMSSVLFWGVILVAGLLMIAASSVTYRYIEEPFIKRKSVKKHEGASLNEMVEKVM